MEKKKPQVVNNKLDGYPEIAIYGDIENYDGQWVSEQINNLDSKKLRLKINSFGGYVTSAFTIVSAMQSFMDAGGEIETINEGRADSAAGWIAACGTRGKRKIMQFAGVFTHAPLFEDGTRIEDLMDGDPRKNELEDAFDKLINIFTAATGRSYNQIKELMTNQSDLDADEAIVYGMADKKVLVNNMPKLKNNLTRAQIVNVTSAIDFETNDSESGSNNKQKRDMKKIAKLLNLNPDASEESIEGAVQALINKSEKAEKDLGVVNTSLATVTSERDTLKNEKKQRDDAEIINYVDGLIKADAKRKDNRDNLINMARSDFETFKSLMPIKSVDDKGAIIDKGIEAEEEVNQDEAEKADAKKFATMSNKDRNDLKNSNYGEFSKLVKAYEKHGHEVV